MSKSVIASVDTRVLGGPTTETRTWGDVGTTDVRLLESFVEFGQRTRRTFGPWRGSLISRVRSLLYIRELVRTTCPHPLVPRPPTYLFQRHFLLDLFGGVSRPFTFQSFLHRPNLILPDPVERRGLTVLLSSVL